MPNKTTTFHFNAADDWLYEGLRLADLSRVYNMMSQDTGLTTASGSFVIVLLARFFVDRLNRRLHVSSRDPQTMMQMAWANDCNNCSDLLRRTFASVQPRAERSPSHESLIDAQCSAAQSAFRRRYSRNCPAASRVDQSPVLLLSQRSCCNRYCCCCWRWRRGRPGIVLIGDEWIGLVENDVAAIKLTSCNRAQTKWIPFTSDLASRLSTNGSLFRRFSVARVRGDTLPPKWQRRRFFRTISSRRGVRSNRHSLRFRLHKSPRRNVHLRDNARWWVMIAVSRHAVDAASRGPRATGRLGGPRYTSTRLLYRSLQCIGI